MAQRRLTDLYVTGKEITIEDSIGEIVVWMQKLNPVQREQAFAKSNSARAKVLTVKGLADDDPDKAQYIVQANAFSQDKDTVIDMLAAEEVTRAEQACEAEVSEQEEWTKDEYLTGLQDSWEDGIKDRFLDKDDKEAQRVFLELKRFADQVEKATIPHKKSIRKGYAHKTDFELGKELVNKLIDSEGDMAWITEYRRCQVWLATREPTDHRKLYFVDRKEVDDLQAEVLINLIQEYANLEVEPQVGKE